MEKKDKYRFTLRFDETDQRQKNAAEILGKLGRKKAKYVAEAVSFYEHFKREEGEVVFPFSALRQPPAQPTKEHDFRTSDVRTAEKERKEAMSNLDAADIAAMKSGMNAFRRKKV